MTARYNWNKAWRLRHPDGRYRSKDRYYSKHRETPANRRNSRQWWTHEHLLLIIAPDRPPDSVLAKQIGRSVQAIQGMRWRLRQTRLNTPSGD